MPRNALPWAASRDAAVPKAATQVPTRRRPYRTDFDGVHHARQTACPRHHRPEPAGLRRLRHRRPRRQQVVLVILVEILKFLVIVHQKDGPGQKKREEIDKLAQQAEDDRKQAERRLAEERRKKEQLRAEQARACVIRPVMSDAEIAKCR